MIFKYLNNQQEIEIDTSLSSYQIEMSIIKLIDESMAENSSLPYGYFGKTGSNRFDLQIKHKYIMNPKTKAEIFKNIIPDISGIISSNNNSRKIKIRVRNNSGSTLILMAFHFLGLVFLLVSVYNLIKFMMIFFIIFLFMGTIFMVVPVAMINSGIKSYLDEFKENLLKYMEYCKLYEYPK